MGGRRRKGERIWGRGRGGDKRRRGYVLRLKGGGDGDTQVGEWVGVGDKRQEKGLGEREDDGKRGRERGGRWGKEEKEEMEDEGKGEEIHAEGG